MKRTNGVQARNDDEWYTPMATAKKLAAWLQQHLTSDTPILCPADLLPNGQESTIPQALREAGFERVRVTRNLPIIKQIGTDALDWEKGEVIVTNPPFSLLVPFRKWAKATDAKFCVLSRPATMRLCWPIPELKDRFQATNGKWVAAAWMQNIHDTSSEIGEPIGDCQFCERKKCPVNQMTGHFTPRTPRPLYGFGTAVKNGSAGWYCLHYTVNGRKTFTRFFHPLPLTQTPKTPPHDADI